jgi:hypothetical protein
MTTESYGLCEAVSDLTSLFMTQAKLPANSRDTCSFIIDWAEEFDRRHAETDWAEVEYLETIDAFFSEKYRAWLESAPARSIRNND